MNRAIVFGIILILIPFSYGLTPLEASSLIADVEISNTITFSGSSNNFYVDNANARLSWFPRDDPIQDVIDIAINPTYTRTPEHIIFEWDNPDRTERITIQSSVKTRNAIIPVREKIAFPLEEIPTEYAKYLGEGEITKQSREIRELAQELSAGKDDAYEVVYSLADWTTTNIEYSLASLGEPAIQTSPEVLESRWGKCDEITALFISLNRALGIPARFVAGYSYSNSPLFEREWGGHGWAEIWFPEVGWVPFDVTYGEYGYLDSGHIKLKTHPDAKETSIDFSARGRDFELVTEPLEITVNARELRAISNPHINIKLSSPVSEVGFGSAVLILAEVENKRDYYVSTRLDIAPTSDTSMLSDTYKNIFLRPNEVKTAPFLVRIDSNLQRGYRYSFPFRIISRLGQDNTITIEVVERGTVYDDSAFDAQIASLSEKTREKNPFTITCIQNGQSYIGETIPHECEISGSYPDKIRICNIGCEDYNVGSGDFTLTTKAEKTSVYTEQFNAYGNGKESSFFVTTYAIQPTQLLVNISSQEKVTPDDTASVEILINHEGSTPENMEVELLAIHSKATEHIDELSRPAKLTFSMPGRNLRPGTNKLILTIEYEDELGTKETEQFTHEIELVDVGFGTKVIFFIEDTWYALANLLG